MHAHKRMHAHTLTHARIHTHTDSHHNMKTSLEAKLNSGWTRPHIHPKTDFLLIDCLFTDELLDASITLGINKVFLN